jgi:hypothetical protein
MSGFFRWFGFFERGGDDGGFWFLVFVMFGIWWKLESWKEKIFSRS